MIVAQAIDAHAGLNASVLPADDSNISRVNAIRAAGSVRFLLRRGSFR